MSKEVQMSIKIESDLRERFMAVAADRHRLAAQITRDLMRLYIADSETPNALTMVSLSIIKLDQRSIKLGDRTQQLSTSEHRPSVFQGFVRVTH